MRDSALSKAYTMPSYVYILASKKIGTLYVGVTDNLAKRVWEHKNGVHKGFTSRHKIHMLVFYEAYDDIKNAIGREKAIKKWERYWKIELIEKSNPEWRDLYPEISV